MKRFARASVLLAGLGAVSLSAQAAGAHHAVDDAAMFDVGKCKLEGWAERETGGARSTTWAPVAGWARWSWA